MLNEQPIFNQPNDPPTTLYPLEPIGIDSINTESLTSYIKRLANAHNITVKTLVKFIERHMNSIRDHTGVQHVLAIDGGDGQQLDWQRALSDLTGQANLHKLTMEFWTSAFVMNRSLHSCLYWCPICYQEQMERGEVIYEKLLHRLASVNVCLVHKCYLQNNCPFCDKKINCLEKRAVIGFCNKCGNWLGSDDTLPDPESKELSIAKSSQEILRIRYKFEHPDSEALNYVIQKTSEFMDCSIGQLSKMLGVGSPYYWRPVSYRRRMHIFMELCYYTNDYPINLLSNQSKPESTVAIEDLSVEAYLDNLLSSNSRLPGLKDIYKRCQVSDYKELFDEYPLHAPLLLKRYNSEVFLYLSNCANSESRQQLRSFLYNRRYSVKYCKENFPDLVEIIYKKHEQAKNDALAYLRKNLDNIPETIPTGSEICKMFDVSQYFLKCTEEWRALKNIERVRNSDKDEYIYSYLENLVANLPVYPPTLKDLARDLAVSKPKLIKINQLACNYIVAERRKYIHRRNHDKIINCIHEMQGEGLRPFMRHVELRTKLWISNNEVYLQIYQETMRSLGYDV